MRTSPDCRGHRARVASVARDADAGAGGLRVARRVHMDSTLLLALVVAAGVGIIATLLMLRRQRLETRPTESPFAVSTEGSKRCPNCGMGNLWTSSTCSSCGRRLPG